MMIFRNCKKKHNFLVMLRVRHLEESASHPLPHQEGVPQVFDALSYGMLAIFSSARGLLKPRLAFHK